MTERPNDPSEGPTAEWFAELAADDPDDDPFARPVPVPEEAEEPEPHEEEPAPARDIETDPEPARTEPAVTSEQTMPLSAEPAEPEAEPEEAAEPAVSSEQAPQPPAEPAEPEAVPGEAAEPADTDGPAGGPAQPEPAEPVVEREPETGPAAQVPVADVPVEDDRPEDRAAEPDEFTPAADDVQPSGASQDGVEALVAAGQAQAGRRQEPPVDTVAAAAQTPERAQPFAELGMKDDEYRRVRDILGRRPTSAELAIYSVMWSEHCSYKSSKVHLRQFADKAPQTDALLVGMGENAGVVDIGKGWAVTFKVESHNHPSYVEPYQGAATGVGGIVRDIISMGARPVAVMDSLRFGPADAPDTQRVLPGVVGGISGYGNSLGLPNIGGETVFDPCYLQNPLVNALCVGVLRHDDIQRATAPGPGNKVVLFGAGTGPDGIGGASVLASATFDDESQRKRPSVQVGDPFMEKLLIECCLELFREDLVVGIQDLGAAGVSCATTELAAAGTGGMHVVLDTVPLRDPTLRPEEILMSESQERMMAVVTPEKADRFLEICARWEIPATVIGEVTDTGRLVMTWRGEVIVDIPPGTAADEGPVYERPLEPPADLGAIQADTPGRLTRPSNAEELRKTVLWLAGSPNLASKTWVTSQYDRYVLGNTVLAMPEDAGVLRIDGDTTDLGIALSLDGNGRYARLDPYSGAQLALSEAYRNVAATGARPLAVTNCLNFGSPEDPGVMWQFARAVEGLADACLALGVPVTGGNVSFYNQTGTTPINPTPVIGVLGVHEDVRRRVNMAFTGEGHLLVLLGQTREEFGGSEWAHVVYGHLGGLPPLVDLAAEKALAHVLVAGAEEGLLSAAHDLSDGGLSQSLVESCLRGGLGCRITLPGDPFVALFSESAGRAVVAVRPGAEGRLGALCEAAGVPVTQLGVVGGDALAVEGLFSIPLLDLREAHESLLPSYAT
jgi:phosphoribosylformylglycinamidine synthase subunit PurL